MDKCKRESCSKPKRAKSLFCSDACNKAWRRANPDRTATPNPDTVQAGVRPGHDRILDPNFVATVTVRSYEIVEDVKVYGRRAVRFMRISTDLRPEPLSPDDKPKLGNRGKYIRLDGSEYQFDAIGQVFECTLVDGKSVAYPAVADLRQAQREHAQTNAGAAI